MVKTTLMLILAIDFLNICLTVSISFLSGILVYQERISQETN